MRNIIPVIAIANDGGIRIDGRLRGYMRKVGMLGWEADVDGVGIVNGLTVSDVRTTIEHKLISQSIGYQVNTLARFRDFMAGGAV